MVGVTLRDKGHVRVRVRWGQMSTAVISGRGRCPGGGVHVPSSHTLGFNICTDALSHVLDP